MAVNNLSHLLMGYNSDSEVDENTQEQQQQPSILSKNMKSGENIASKLNEFLNEIESETVTDWTQCIDTNTGHPYYWNIVTKEVTWEMPQEYEDFLKKNETIIATNVNKWSLCYSEDQTPYYFNDVTREISWEKPEGFVEAADAKTPYSNTCDTKTKDSIISREKTKEKDKKEKLTKRSYPFKELEDEKIELITNYNPPESSSEEESGRNAASRKRKVIPNTTTKLSLVPEYNTDDDDDSDEGETPAKQKPLFSCTVDILQQNKVQSIKLNQMKTSSPIEINQCTESPILPVQKKSKPSFASIITGGRSPSQQTSPPNVELVPDTDDGAITAELNSIETNRLAQKLFKRKRRIEFNTTQAKPIEFNTTQAKPISSKSSPLENDMIADATSQEAIMANIDGSGEKEENSSNKTKSNLYANFQKSGMEFVSLSDNVANSQDEGVTNLETEIKEINKNDINGLKDVLNAKLKFLCQGHPGVSAVQIIDIQLQALVEGYSAGAVRSAYIFKWMENVSMDLNKLENEAAPDGWKCIWDRGKCQYCYKNLTTDEITWEYPKLAKTGSPAAGDGTIATEGSTTTKQNTDDTDDAMDISTTPPPNSQENLLEPIDAPAPPTWRAAKAAFVKTHMLSGEPLPPGIDLSEYSDKPADDINYELATFYSDIASLEQTETTTNAPQEDMVNPSTADAQPTAMDGEEEKKKKRKKKVKKLEPWRSGNLETWINKWQKAQKELDG